MALMWKKEGDDEILVANERSFGARDTEVLRINGKTGEVKYSKALTHKNALEVSATIGAEASNAIDVACSVKDALGKDVVGVRQVCIKTLAATDAQGTLAAATAAAGTIKKAHNPATGQKVQWMETTAAGKFSFKVTDTAAEDCMVEISGEGIRPRQLKLTFT
jgi:hypothetical protein